MDPVKTMASKMRKERCGCGGHAGRVLVRKHRPTGWWGVATLFCGAEKCRTRSDLVRIELWREGAGLRRRGEALVANVIRPFRSGRAS